MLHPDYRRSTMRAYIESEGQMVLLAAGETTVGRDLCCGIRYNDPSVSRQHARIVVEAEAVLVEDLGSMNGTTVNGVPVEDRQALCDGDEVDVGGRVFHLRIATAGRAAGGAEEQITTRPHERAAEPGGIAPLPRVPPIVKRCVRCRASVPIQADQCHQCGRAFAAAMFRSVTRLMSRADDRRSEVRWPVQLPVIYASESLTFDGVAWDLSVGGMFLPSPQTEAPGTRCRLALLPNGMPAMHLCGVVAHVAQHAGADARPPGIGIRFDPEPEAVALLSQLVRRIGPAARTRRLSPVGPED